MNTTRTANSPPHALTRSGPGKRRSILKKSKAVKQNRRSRNILLAALGLSVVGGLYWAVRDQKATVVPSSPVGPPPPSANQPLPNAEDVARVPPYHESAEAARPFPALLPAAYFPNTPLAARAYQFASEIPEVLVQQPCYCYCDRYGHKSLLDCYASDHGAG